MKMVHVFVKLQDTFSFAYTSRIITKPEPEFEKMKKGIGTTFKHFDKVQQVASTYKVIEVRQAVPDDYKRPSL